jgi:RNA polymerase sigma factor (sigma-70 family)
MGVNQHPARNPARPVDIGSANLIGSGAAMRRSPVSGSGGLPLDANMDTIEDAYALYAAEVYRVVRAIVGDAQTAEDVTHDAFIKALKNLHRLDGHRPIRPWLLTIAMRLALDHRRRERLWHLLRRSSRIGDSEPEFRGAIDTRFDVDDALRTLSPKERAVVVARHYLGMSYQEIAETLAISPSNVGTMLHRAHARLRTILILRDASSESTVPQALQGNNPKGSGQ